MVKDSFLQHHYSDPIQGSPRRFLKIKISGDPVLDLPQNNHFGLNMGTIHSISRKKKLLFPAGDGLHLVHDKFNTASPWGIGHIGGGGGALLGDRTHA